jgi:hypothetical protein
VAAVTVITGRAVVASTSALVKPVMAMAFVPVVAYVNLTARVQLLTLAFTVVAEMVIPELALD